MVGMQLSIQTSGFSNVELIFPRFKMNVSQSPDLFFQEDLYLRTNLQWKILIRRVKRCITTISPAAGAGMILACVPLPRQKNMAFCNTRIATSWTIIEANMCKQNSVPRLDRRGTQLAIHLGLSVNPTLKKYMKLSLLE